MVLKYTNSPSSSSGHEREHPIIFKALFPLDGEYYVPYNNALLFDTEYNFFTRTVL